MPFKRICLLLLIIGAVFPSAAMADARGADPQEPNPLAGLTFYNDPESPSMQEWRHLERMGDHAKADLIWKIAGQPKALWLGRFTRPNFAVKVRRLIDPAKARGEVPIFSVLRAQATGCGPTYQGGGPGEDRATEAWYDDLARVIGDDRVVIAFEPDSLGTIDCLARSRQDDRLRVLAHGVDVLSKLPNATVYIEAGASDWESAARTARQLRQVGVAKVRGFMLNVTHYDWTGANIQHGLDISRRMGGKHFIINTAENGRGPVNYNRYRNHRVVTVWCNPGLRGLGPAPTTDTSQSEGGRIPLDQPARVRAVVPAPPDRLVPAAGADAGRVMRPSGRKAPPGTRFGHFKHYPLKAFNIP